MIELLDVCKRYGAVAAVDGVSLQIAPGSITVLVGASGSGKSTLLRLVNRLIELDGGRILLDGADIRCGPPELLRRRIGYVIQSTGLFPHWTVASNIATVPRLLDWPAARIRARVDELLDMLALDPAAFRDRYPHQLSGGEQQRVGVARALAAQPAVLLMDEPFAALDPLTRQALQRQLAQIQRSLQTTVLMVTHDIDEALLLGHQLVLLHQGKVAQAGTPRQLLMNPASERVAAFFGTTPVELRRLEFRTVGELMRPGESADGPPLRPEQNLQQALVAFLAARCDRLAVADREGRTIGAIRFADLLGPAA